MTVPRIPAAKAAKSSGPGRASGAIRARAIVRFLSVEKMRGRGVGAALMLFPTVGARMRARVDDRGRTYADEDATDDDPVLGIVCRVLEQPDGSAVLGDPLEVSRIRDRGE